MCIIGNDIRERDLVIFDLSNLTQMDDTAAYLIALLSIVQGSRESRSCSWAFRTRSAKFSTPSMCSNGFPPNGSSIPTTRLRTGEEDSELSGPFQKGGVVNQLPVISNKRPWFRQPEALASHGARSCRSVLLTAVVGQLSEGPCESDTVSSGTRSTPFLIATPLIFSNKGR